MEDDLTYLFIGSGIVSGSLIIGLVAGIVSAFKEKNRGFRYGAFFLSMSLVFVPGLFLGYIFVLIDILDDSLIYITAIPSAMFGVGILIAYRLMEFKGKGLMIIVSVPYVFTLWLSPIFIWNLIYIFAIYRPDEKPVQQVGVSNGE